MALGILVLLTALSISAVAIYYSVAGLVAIFAAAALPIMVMGGVLEVGKLVTAVWLHRYWKQAAWWLRTYLATAVIILMFITSMGIFGFLSKAHIEQTSAGQESVAQVERLTAEIGRQNDIIKRAEEQITKLETSGTGNDANIQSQIDKEQERIDNAYARIQPAIDEQQAIIDSQGQLYRDELAKIDADIATLQGYIDNGEVKKAQQMIGASADGVFGKKTADKIGEWKAAKQTERAELITKIEQATNNPQARRAADEIRRLRTTAETQIAESNRLINRLREQLGNTDKAANIDAEVDEQTLRIKNANAEIDRLTEEKYALEGEYRKLEAEVGPIKYIAEFIYGEAADTNMLEEAVRWVIIVIIFVFDPLAVLLLIASQYTFEFRRKKLEDDSGDRLRLEREEYERARAQRIIDNPGFNIDVDKETSDENREETREEATQDVEELRTGQDEESIPSETGDDSDVAETSQEESVTPTEDIVQSYIQETDPETVDVQEPAQSVDDVQDTVQESAPEPPKTQKKDDTVIPDTRNKIFYPDELDDATTYVTKDEFGNQVRKYKQNEEQSENSIWNRIKRNED